MNKEDFIERLQNDMLLASDDISLWRELADQYPYASLIQNMLLHRIKEPSGKNFAEAALYKNDPVKFYRRTVLPETVPILSVDNSQHLNDPVEAVHSEHSEEDIETGAEETVTNENIDPEEKPVDINLPEEPEAEPLSDAEEQNEEVETVSDISFKDESLPEEKTGTVEKMEQEPEAITDVDENKEDIIALINELPDSNPMTEKYPGREEEEEKGTGRTETEPKDLMVMMSFTDWLLHYKSTSHKEKEEEEDKSQLRSRWQQEKLQEALKDDVDEIPEKIFKQVMDSISFGPELISESLAEVLASQGKLDKAIEMYKKLSLKNPEKSAYFASKIKDLHLSNE